MIWTHRAGQDLFDITAHVARDAPRNAAAIAERITARVDRLIDQPQAGRRVPEYTGPREVREVFVHRWRIIHEVSVDQIVVLAILHSARRLENASLL